jgi:acyl-CoA synthetase (AMP-forming)/AMP-acid ligase II
MPEHWYFRRLRQRAQASPRDVCLELHSAGRRLSFSEMECGIAAAAALLRDRGVKSDDIVLIFAQHDAGTFYAFFAAQALGAVPSFMSPPTGRQPLDLWFRDHRELIARIEPALLVCGEEIAAQLAELATMPLLTSAALERDLTRAAFEPAPFDADRIAFLQHSSGTTGLKKGVTVTYRELRAQIESYSAALGIGEGDCVVSWLPVYHDMGLIAATLMPFVLGLPVALIDTLHWLEEPSTYLALLAQRPNAFSWLPNFAFPFLAQRGQLPSTADLSAVRAIINCSEPCKAPAMEAFRARFAEHGLPANAVQVCYAMAEYVFAVTQTTDAPHILSIDPKTFDTEHRATSRENGRPVVSVGRPIRGAQIRIGDNMVDGDVGEVFVRGPSLCSGYYRAPEITTEKFAGGWYRTGDLGFLHLGELYITGRLDDVIIVRGKNLYAHDLEMLASGTGLIRPGRAVAFGIEDSALGTEKLIIICEVMSIGVHKEAGRAVRAAIREAYGLSPADVVFVPPDTLVKTSSGKISRAENRRRYLAGGLAPWAAMKEPANAG